MPTRTPAEPPKTRGSEPPRGSLPGSPSTERTDTTATHRSTTNAAPQPTDSATGKDSDTTGPSGAAEPSDANRILRPRQSAPTRRSQRGARRAKRPGTADDTTTPAKTVTNDPTAPDRQSSPHTTQRLFSPPRFRGYRHVRDLTHSEVAKRAELTPAEVERIEKGEQVPEPSTIAALATVLGCTAADLHTTGDPMNNEQYWDVKCAALPPLSADTIRSVAATLDRIEARRRGRGAH